MGFSIFTCPYIIVIVDNTLICFWGIRKGAKKAQHHKWAFVHLIRNKWGENWLTTTCFPSLMKTIITTGLWLKSLLQKLDEDTSPFRTPAPLTIPAICTEWPNLGKKSIYQSLKLSSVEWYERTSAAAWLPTHKQLRSSEYYNLKTIEQIHYITTSVCHLFSFITSLACTGTIKVRLWEGGGYLWPILVDSTLYSMNVYVFIQIERWWLRTNSK